MKTKVNFIEDGYTSYEKGYILAVPLKDGAVDVTKGALVVTRVLEEDEKVMVELHDTSTDEKIIMHLGVFFYEYAFDLITHQIKFTEALVNKI